jgi:transposase
MRPVQLGFGLARFLRAADVECLVAAPSKLQRPAGDRVKTDKRDALHLAKLLKLGEIVEVNRSQCRARGCPGPGPGP